MRACGWQCLLFYLQLSAAHLWSPIAYGRIMHMLCCRLVVGRSALAPISQDVCRRAATLWHRRYKPTSLPPQKSVMEHNVKRYGKSQVKNQILLLINRIVFVFSEILLFLKLKYSLLICVLVFLYPFLDLVQVVLVWHPSSALLQKRFSLSDVPHYPQTLVVRIGGWA